MSWKKVKQGERVPDVFVMNLDFADFSEMARLSRQEEFQERFDRLRSRIEGLFSGDDRFRFTWAGDGLVVLFKDRAYHADDLVERCLKVIDLVRRKNKRPEFGKLLSVRIGLNAGNIVFHKEIGKITGTTMNLAGHLQKHCPDTGGILMRDKVETFIKGRKLLKVFSLKRAYIKGRECDCYYYPFDPSVDVPHVIGYSDSVTLNLTELYGEKAAVKDINRYTANALRRIGFCRSVVLTGGAPVWLYLAIARSLHGKVSRLVYSAPNSGDVVIFDHTQPAIRTDFSGG